MNDVISNLKNKLNVKYFIYLPEEKYRIYKSPLKLESDIPSGLLNNTLFEVIEENMVDNEQFYLISAQGNELGWVTVEAPILIMNTYPEKVLVKAGQSFSSLNELFKINYTFEKDKFYTKRYVVLHENEIYYGLTDKNELAGFVSSNQINDGKIQPEEFKFNTLKGKIYQDIFRNIESTFFSNDKQYICDILFEMDNRIFGSFKLGKKRYWFDINQTNIKYEQISYPKEKSREDIYLEHIFYTQTLEPKYIPNESGNIEKEIVNDLVNDYKMEVESLEKELEKSKEQHIFVQKELDVLKIENKSLSDDLQIANVNKIKLQNQKENLELKIEKHEKKQQSTRKSNSNKIDYFERLTASLENKNDYLTQRNANLVNRVEVLSSKLEKMTDKYNKLKASRLGSLQLKYWNRKK